MMKENNMRIRILIGFLMVWMPFLVTGNTIDPSDDDSTEWEVVSIDGKLRMEGLPLSPTVKIFMQKDSLIDISLRAPFIGEAGRLIVTPDSAIVINKMKKVWATVPFSDVPNAPVTFGIEMLQEMILGHFFLPGIDVEAVDLDDYVDVYYGEEGQYNIIPKGEAEIPGIKYGFVVDEEFNPLMLVVLPEEKEMEIDLMYTYKSKGYDIQANYYDDSRSLEALLELKDPEWKGAAPKGMVPDKKYRKVSLSDFMRSF